MSAGGWNFVMSWQVGGRGSPVSNAEAPPPPPMLFIPPGKEAYLRQVPSTQKTKRPR